MKAETEKKIKELVSFGDYILNEEYRAIFKEKIQKILECEAHETKIGNFSIYDYVGTDKFRPQLMGVMHQDGWKIASNGYILIKVRLPYAESYENKIVKKDCEIIDGTFPRYNAVLPQDISTWNDVSFDLDRLAEVVKKAKAHKKIYGKTKSFVKVGSLMHDVDLLAKFGKALKAFRGFKLVENEKSYMLYAEHEDMKALLMAKRFSDDELLDESVFVDEL